MSKGLSSISAVLGLLEFGDITAIFIPGFGTIQAFVWSHIAAGLILMVVGGWAALTPNVHLARLLDGLAAATGVRIMAAPFVLGRPTRAVALWTDIIVGIVVLGLGVWAALAAPGAPAD